jgi:hypothetical protein
VGIRCADHATPSPPKLALTSPTSGGRSVGIVRSRTKATEFSLVFKKKEKPKITGGGDTGQWLLSGSVYYKRTLFPVQGNRSPDSLSEGRRGPTSWVLQYTTRRPRDLVKNVSGRVSCSHSGARILLETTTATPSDNCHPSQGPTCWGRLGRPVSRGHCSWRWSLKPRHGWGEGRNYTEFWRRNLLVNREEVGRYYTPYLGEIEREDDNWLALWSAVVTIRTTYFNSKQNLHSAHTVYLCVFRMVLTINSDCFPKQH